MSAAKLLPILLILSSCASEPPLPADLAACQAELRAVQKRAAEADKDVSECLDYLKSCSP